MPKTESFDKHSKRYDDWFEDNRHAYLSELKAVRHFIPEKGNGLEIGVGSGKFAEPLRIKTGIDPSRKMRELAKERGLDVYDAVAEALPFEDNSFDYALMVTSVCFLDDIGKAFEEVKRVLKANGLFIIGFVDSESPLGRIYEKNKHKNVFYRDAVFYSTGEIMGILDKAGFAGIETVQTVFGALSEIGSEQDFKTGYGEGGFVAVKSINES
jgi:ubiquinone/menaquinone biosynthesis C-methylase UbiE